MSLVPVGVRGHRRSATLGCGIDPSGVGPAAVGVSYYKVSACESEWLVWDGYPARGGDLYSATPGRLSRGSALVNKQVNKQLINTRVCEHVGAWAAVINKRKHTVNERVRKLFTNFGL